MTAQALESFTSMADVAQAQCDKFAHEFAKNPSYALRWGNDVFKNAARLKIAQQMVYMFTEREGDTVLTLEQARKILMESVMNKARWPAQSTSPTSNLMEQFEAAALAEALDELKHLE